MFIIGVILHIGQGKENNENLYFDLSMVPVDLIKDLDFLENEMFFCILLLNNRSF